MSELSGHYSIYNNFWLHYLNRSIIPEYFPPVEGEDEVLEDQNTETASGTTSDDLQ